MKHKTKVIRRERRVLAARRKKAMPIVQRLVKRFGRTTIANCLGKLAHYDKQQQRLQDLKREIAAIERTL